MYVPFGPQSVNLGAIFGGFRGRYLDSATSVHEAIIGHHRKSLKRKAIFRKKGDGSGSKNQENRYFPQTTLVVAM